MMCINFSPASRCNQWREKPHGGCQALPPAFKKYHSDLRDNLEILKTCVSMWMEPFFLGRMSCRQDFPDLNILYEKARRKVLLALRIASHLLLLQLPPRLQERLHKGWICFHLSRKPHNQRLLLLLLLLLLHLLLLHLPPRLQERLHKPLFIC